MYMNQMILPAAVLNEDNIYNPERPKYMNFGAIGFWIGHEISHGFDSKGRHYNEEGNLKEWWDDETEEGYVVCKRNLKKKLDNNNHCDELTYK